MKNKQNSLFPIIVFLSGMTIAGIAVMIPVNSPALSAIIGLGIAQALLSAFTISKIKRE